jgi:hypothetical protein
MLFIGAKRVPTYYNTFARALQPLQKHLAYSTGVHRSMESQPNDAVDPVNAMYMQEQLDDKAEPATTFEPRYWFSAMGGQKRYREWGYLVFRTCYESEDDWKATLEIIRRQIKSNWEDTVQEGELDQRLLSRWMPKLRLEIKNDATKYNGLPVAEVQKHFRDWAIQDFDTTITAPVGSEDPYDDTWGPYDRDERVVEGQILGTTDQDREQNMKFALSNKGAMHQACLMIDEKSMKSILDAERNGKYGNIKLVDVSSPGDGGISEGYTECSVGTLGSAWAWITHYGSLRE